MNDRMQMTSQELKRGSETLQKYQYGYGQLDGSGNLDMTKNNGQLSQIESYIGTTKQWTKKFSYDHIGRLSEEKELRGDNNSQVYKNVYDFDRFGNMYRKAANNGNALAYTAIEDSAINKSTNRFTSNTTYDEAGSVLTDNKFREMEFGYDANGRMVNTKSVEKPDMDFSVYDAAGMRVAERIDDIWRFMVYDIGGKLVAEYGGVQSSDEGGIKYLMSDWQGSTRAMLSNSGFIQARMDYTAYGEDIGSGTGLRTATQGFGVSSSLRQKYGLTERDQSTGLNHTWFRKNENRAGRWTSPDPYGGSVNIGDPQSFNRYSYVTGQPTNFVDPSGLLQVMACQWYVWVRVYSDGREEQIGNPFQICFNIGNIGTVSVFGGNLDFIEPSGGSVLTEITPRKTFTPASIAAYEDCLKKKVQNRVNGVNHRRDEELKRNILGSVAPSPVPAPFGWFSPVAMTPGGVMLPDQTDNQLTANFIMGMWNPESLGPIGAATNILFAGAAEGTYGYYNNSQSLTEAKTVTEADKNDCIRQNNNP